MEADKAAQESAKCEVIAVEVAQKKDECERDLAEAIPAVARAMAALDTITKKDLGELKALKKPPSGIDDVLAAVMVLLSPPEGVRRSLQHCGAVTAVSRLSKTGAGAPPVRQ